MNDEKSIEDLNELEDLSNDEFRLPISIHTILYIEPAGMKANIKCELVGIKHQSYLIADLQDSVDLEFIEINNLKPGASIACRYMHDGAVYGFRSNLMSLYTTPIKLMTIQYPKDVEERNRRTVNRTGFGLPSTIKFGLKTYSGSIIDLSEKGCQLAILKRNIDEKGMDILINNPQKDAHIMFQLPGEEEVIKASVVIRNTRLNSGKFCLGLEFNNLDQESYIIINAFVEEMRSYLLV